MRIREDPAAPSSPAHVGARAGSDIHHCNDPDFDLPTFSRMIGHASIRTTMEIYAHLEIVLNNSIPRTEADLKEF